MGVRGSGSCSMEDCAIGSVELLGVMLPENSYKF
jgi:hypothetical protein